MKLDTRVWYLLSAVLAIAIVVGGFLVGIQPQLAAASVSAGSLSQVQSQNTALKAKVSSLAAESAQLDSSKAKLAALAQQVPGDVESTEFLAEVNTIAASTGVQLKSLQVNSQRPYNPPVTAAAATTTTTGTSTATPTPTPSATATTPPVAGAPATDPLITASNFVLVPVSMQVAGTDAQTLAFVAALRAQPRLVLINSVSLGNANANDSGSNAKTDSYSITLGGFMFAVSTGS